MCNMYARTSVMGKVIQHQQYILSTVQWQIFHCHHQVTMHLTRPLYPRVVRTTSGEVCLLCEHAQGKPCSCRLDTVLVPSQCLHKFHTSKFFCSLDQDARDASICEGDSGFISEKDLSFAELSFGNKSNFTVCIFYLLRFHQ